MKFTLKNGNEVDLTIGYFEDTYALVDAEYESYATLERDDTDRISFYCNNASSIFADSQQVFQTKLARLAFEYMMQEYSGIEEESESESESEYENEHSSTNTNDIDSSSSAYEDEDNPFNPDKISIDNKVITVDRVLKRIEQGTIVLNPDFQRSEVWDDERKSRLIESLLLRIPIPMFYVSSDEKGTYTVVDGLQRLSTMRDFVLGQDYVKDPIKCEKRKGDGMRLKGLEFWTEYEDKTMNDLPIYLQNRLLETEFNFTIINPGTPEVVRRNIFRRINTGGMPLSSQEIRNALYGGRATLLLSRLVKRKEFTKATVSVKSERMEDKELVLRLISFFVRKPEKFIKSTSADIWLSDTMILLNAMPELNTKEFRKLQERLKGTDLMDSITILHDEEIEDKFCLAMVRAHKLFGPSAFRKSLPGHRRSPINKALFEVWGVLLARMSETRFQSLFANQAAFFKDYGNLLSQDDFIVAISRDSLRATSVKDRYMKLTNIIYKHSDD